MCSMCTPPLGRTTQHIRDAGEPTSGLLVAPTSRTLLSALLGSHPSISTRICVLRRLLASCSPKTYSYTATVILQCHNSVLQIHNYSCAHSNIAHTVHAKKTATAHFQVPDASIVTSCHSAKPLTETGSFPSICSGCELKFTFRLAG